MDVDNPFATIAAEPPDLDAAEAEALVAEHYGFQASARPLVSERDQNFLITAADGDVSILKVANAAEPREVTRFQIDALLHIENHGDDALCVPRIISCNSGDSAFEIRTRQGEHLCRMVTFLPGKLMGESAASSIVARSLGGTLARLDLALSEYTHPGEQQPLLWDMKKATALRRLLPQVSRERDRSLLAATLEEFESLSLTAFEALPWQVIHNDANPANVLLNDNGVVSGLIDFGDMLRSPRIIELAVAAAYLRVFEGNPLAMIVELVAGYHAVAPLERAEVAALHTLIKTRLASTVLILAWRSQLREPDDDYLSAASASEAGALPFLERMSEIPGDNAEAIYSQVCASEGARGRSAGDLPRGGGPEAL